MLSCFVFFSNILTLAPSTSRPLGCRISFRYRAGGRVDCAVAVVIAAVRSSKVQLLCNERRSLLRRLNDSTNLYYGTFPTFGILKVPTDS